MVGIVRLQCRPAQCDRERCWKPPEILLHLLATNLPRQRGERLEDREQLGAVLLEFDPKVLCALFGEAGTTARFRQGRTCWPKPFARRLLAISIAGQRSPSRSRPLRGMGTSAASAPKNSVALTSPRSRSRRATRADAVSSPTKRFSFRLLVKFRARLISLVSPRGQYARKDAKGSSERNGFTDIVRGENLKQVGHFVEDEGAVVDHLLRP